MLCGVDQLFTGQLSGLRRRLRGSRLGVLTHAAAVDRRGRHLLSVLDELGASPRLIFAPEHGLEAVAQAEEAVGSEAAEGKTPIFSLYGKTKEALTPAAEQLAEIDLLLIDLADVGSRYYTYAWTALLAARAASAAGIHTVVLDRPNPISGDPATLEGAPQQEASCRSLASSRYRFGTRSASVSCSRSSWSAMAKRSVRKARCRSCRCSDGSGTAARKRGDARS